MKKASITILLAISISGLIAQAPAKNDPDAKKILDGVSEKFKAYKTVKATFTITSENAAGKTLSSKKGTVLIKGSRYRVSIIGQEIFCDGVNLWTYDKAANEVVITKFESDNASLTPQKMFTNSYDKDFLYKLNGEKKQGAKTIQEIEMTPKDKTKSFSKVYLYVDKAAKTISGSRVIQNDSNRSLFTVNSFTPNKPIDESQFTFDAKKYPGVEVVDNR
jgi:outer membrane lipoprotein-sorting protein